MKKLFVSMLIVIMLILGFNIVWADEYEKPILFRGIEWGSKYGDALKALPEGVRMYGLQDREYWYSVDEQLFDESKWKYKGILGCYTYAMSSSLEGAKVAGYQIDQLYLYFTYLPDDNGLLVKDENHTALVYGMYKLEPKDVETVYSDLITKLTSLYGDVDVSQTKSPYISYTQNAWKGADGTIVSLVKEDYPSGPHYIWIRYSFEGANTLIDNAYEALVLEESINSASDTDGL